MISLSSLDRALGSWLQVQAEMDLTLEDSGKNLSPFAEQQGPSRPLTIYIVSFRFLAQDIKIYTRRRK
jgi:hypothetical protein